MNRKEMLQTVKQNLRLGTEDHDLIISDLILTVCDYWQSWIQIAYRTFWNPLYEKRRKELLTMRPWRETDITQRLQVSRKVMGALPGHRRRETRRRVSMACLRVIRQV